MSDSNATESPLEAIEGTAGPRTTRAFSILGNETRLSILVVLWEAYQPFAEENAVPFSELRERVGMRDSGQFNYHLDKLTGHFIEKTDDGYVFRNAGLRLVQTVIASFGIEEPPDEPTEIQFNCGLCGAQTAITYVDERMYLVCTECEGVWGSSEEWPEGMLAGGYFNPAGFTGRSPIEAWTANWVAVSKTIESNIEGVCEVCSGRMERSLDVCGEHGAEGYCVNCGRANVAMAHFRCSVCKNDHRATPRVTVSHHPSVVGFFDERGVPLQYEVGDYELGRQAGKLISTGEEVLVSHDPPRVQVTFKYEGDELQVTLNEDLKLSEISETNNVD